MAAFYRKHYDDSCNWTNAGRKIWIKGFIVCNGNLINDNTDIDERELRNRNPKFGRFNRPNLF